MRKALILIIPLGLALLAGCGGETAVEEAGDVLARVGGRNITMAEFEKELEQVPPFQRREMETPQGKQKFLDRIVEMELLYLAALGAGLEEDAKLLEEMERARRTILMRHYYKEHVEAKAQPAEDEIGGYYEEHSEEFAVKERLRARMILAGGEKSAKNIRKRVEGGEDFASLARTESKDGATAAEDGDLGWFTRDGYVRSIGVKEDFTAQIFALSPGDISEPIEVEDKGWAIILVEEKEAARQKGLDEVRGDIARRLAPQARERYYRERIDALKVEYEVEYVGEPFLAAATPESLFEMAQSATDPHERIGYYEQVVERFGDSEQADRAMFMVGFVYSEELQDKQQARAAFLRFLELYPESDLAKDAQYMLDALEGSEPPFELE